MRLFTVLNKGGKRWGKGGKEDGWEGIRGHKRARFARRVRQKGAVVGGRRAGRGGWRRGRKGFNARVGLHWGEG